MLGRNPHTTAGPERYYATAHLPLHGWQIRDHEDDHLVDVTHSAKAAAYEVDLLNTGRAHVEAHAVIGCRVVLNRVPVAA